MQFTRADGAVSDSLGFEVEVSVPNVLSVNPDRIVLTDETSPDRRQRITILGSGFGDYDTQDPPSNRVSLGGVPLEAPKDGWETERIWALAPTLADCKKVGLDVPGRTELVVIDRYGRRSAPTVVEFVEGDNSNISRENIEQASRTSVGRDECVDGLHTRQPARQQHPRGNPGRPLRRYPLRSRRLPPPAIATSN